MEECINCLNSTSGECHLHQAKYFNGTLTTSTSTTTKEDCFNKIYNTTKKLMRTKWYQFKLRNELIKSLRYWFQELKNFSKE